LTESTFGAFTLPDGSFDEYHPDNTAPLVGYLCSGSARHITGRVFMISGGVVELLQPWHVAGRIHAGDQRWSIDELERAQLDLFGGEPSGLPPLPQATFPAPLAPAVSS